MSTKKEQNDDISRQYEGKIQSLIHPDSERMLWVGRLVSTLVVLFLVIDGAVKVMQLTPAVEGTVELGYPADVVVWLGIVLLVSTILYSIPRTAVLGAILLTGYLGGATATQVRVENPWFLFPVLLGVLVWVALFMRDNRLRALILGRNDRLATNQIPKPGAE
jgi:hypothetical protein